MARRRGSDGFAVRDSGPWATEKLHYVHRYCELVCKAMKAKFPILVYLDLMAGPGRCCIDRHPFAEFDGSPLLAMAHTPGFQLLVFIEQDPELFAALRERLPAADERWKIIPADCNSEKAVKACRAALSAGRLGIAFLDALGCTDPAFETVETIAAGQRLDLIVTFHVQDVNRNADEAIGGGPSAQRFTRFFGSAGWKKALLDAAPSASAGETLAGFYETRLQSLGYQTKQLHRLMKNRTNAPLYRLIFASKHDLGTKFWAKVTKHGPSQRSLF